VSPSSEEPFFELVAETLDNLDRAARAQFLQRFFKNVAQLELSEVQALEYWERIFTHRRELADSLGKPVSLKRAMLDVLAASTYLRVPILIEYEQLKKLEFNAATDPLTGLYNRRFFDEQFDREINRASRYNQHLALVMLDLHQFKEVNDRYGHPRGDLLLRTAAHTLRRSLRTSDYAFRIGGDEFALLLVQSDKEQAITLARRVRSNFATAVEPMHMAPALALDFGVAVYPADGDQKEVMIRVADERLYEMKYSQRTAGATSDAAAADQRARTELISAILPSLQRPPTAAKERELRESERVPLGGSKAYAELLGEPKRMVRVLDLGYGGVALEISAVEQLEDAFEAMLHVPVLPPVRVSLRKVYQVGIGAGQTRVGCAFVT
jgi:diguanylate cyclase (GGDEF)-like protein